MSDPTSALRAMGGTGSQGASLPSIPAVPTVDSAAMANFLGAVKSWIDNASGAGTNGLATKQDLVATGVAKLTVGGGIAPGAVSSTTIPPAPTGLSVYASSTSNILTWDDPTSLYANHGNTEIFAASVDNFSLATLIASYKGGSFSHAIGADETRYYWIRFVSSSDVSGPFNDISGTVGTTPAASSSALDALTDPTDPVPFFELLTPTVIDGVTIPAGRYLKKDYIFDGCISSEKIKAGAITDLATTNYASVSVTPGSTIDLTYIPSGDSFLLSVLIDQLSATLDVHFDGVFAYRLISTAASPLSWCYSGARTMDDITLKAVGSAVSNVEVNVTYWKR
jgi:hypothetical protein